MAKRTNFLTIKLHIYRCLKLFRRQYIFAEKMQFYQRSKFLP